MDDADDTDDLPTRSGTNNQSPEQVSVISTLPREAPEGEVAGAGEGVSYCCAMYDYDGEEGEDDLTFEEGQIIRVFSKKAHDVDDGWWRGELEGRVGNFPSLVVEECDEYGEPLTNEWEDTPPCSAPPVFTPPAVPEYLIGADSSLDQQSPVTLDSQDTGEGVVAVKPIAGAAQTPGFSLELSKDQQEQYGLQFESQNVPSKLFCLRAGRNS